MTFEADQAAIRSDTARSPAEERGGSSEEPPAIQIKMPNSDSRPRPRMRNRPQTKNLGGLEQLLQSLMKRLDENDRRYSEALGGLNDRLNDLSERAHAVSNSETGETGAALDRLRQQANSLAEQVGAVDASHKAQQSAFAATGTETLPYSSGNDDRPRPDFGDNRLNKNFAEVTEKLERSLSEREPARDFDALSAQMDALAHRFDTALDARKDLAALEKIESQLNTLTAGFAEAQRNYEKVDAIEGHLLNLLHWAETTGSQQQKGSDDGRLAAIEQALIDLSDSAREMDSRTVSTLEAMNEALHSLAAHASSAPAMPVSPPPSVPGEFDATVSRPVPDTRMSAPDAENLARQPIPPVTEPSSPASDSAGSAYDGLGATIPDYQPPSGKSAATAPPMAAPDQSARQDHDRQNHDRQDGDAAFEADSDFIASARRAAAAAAAQQPSTKPPETSSRSKWSFPKASSEALSSVASSGDTKTRPILVIAAVLLLVVSAGLLYSRLNSTPDGQPAVEAPQSAAPDADGTTGNPAAKEKQEAAPPQSGQTGSPDSKQHSERMHDAPSATPPEPSPQPRQTVRDQNAPAQSGRGRVDIAPGQQITTATLLASLPPEVRNPAPPDVTMEIKDPAPQANAARAGKPPAGTGPALVPGTPATPHMAALPQPKRVLPRAQRQQRTASHPSTIDSAPANEVGNATNGAREVMPPALIGPQSLRVAAARGNPAAQVEIGSRYAKGIGVPKDLKKAADWYMRAAAQGHAPAQYRLAAMHERGHGVKKDEGVALTWYRRAAELGNVRAMHNLAVLYTRRTSGGTDFTSAKNWFYQAARHGLADSQYNLGMLYESGLGTRKNIAEAYKWFTFAAQQGDEEARKRREAIRPRLPAKSLHAAEKAIRAWKKVPANEDANRTGPPRGGWRNASAAPQARAMSADLVTRAQKLLNKLGYDAGIADGRLGPQTKSAIRRFETRSGTAGDGTVTPALLRQLEALAS